MSYATVREADCFFDKIYGSKWETLGYEDKCRLLENATLNIDRYEYSGEKKDPNQENAFPRIFCDGTESDEKLVKRACCEEAMHIYESGESGVVVSSSDIKSFRLGDVDVTLGGDNTAEATDTPIDNILKDYLKGGSARILL